MKVTASGSHVAHYRLDIARLLFVAGAACLNWMRIAGCMQQDASCFAHAWMI